MVPKAVFGAENIISYTEHNSFDTESNLFGTENSIMIWRHQFLHCEIINLSPAWFLNFEMSHLNLKKCQTQRTYQGTGCKHVSSKACQKYVFWAKRTSPGA